MKDLYSLLLKGFEANLSTSKYVLTNCTKSKIRFRYSSILSLNCNSLSIGFSYLMMGQTLQATPGMDWLGRATQKAKEQLLESPMSAKWWLYEDGTSTTVLPDMVINMDVSQMLPNFVPICFEHLPDGLFPSSRNEDVFAVDFRIIDEELSSEYRRSAAHR